ncbi:hypothetical protein K438DRAFT_1661260, partial [Mycena galopus ATCC 62051]
MSSTSSPPALKSRKKGATTKPTTTRSLSASEIARNFKNFEIWGSHHKCEQASFSDMPEDFKDDIKKVFDFSSKPKLPASWVDPKSREFSLLPKLASKGLIEFLKEIHDQNPKLFGEIAESEIPGLLERMGIVHSAWRRLEIMKQSKEKYSEADYAANVYNVFRSPAIRESTHRVQSNISLPQPSVSTNLDSATIRILGTKAASPDCVIMIPSAAISSLSLSKDSPFQVLKRHPNVVKSGNVSKCSSFRFQSTPLVAPPEMPAFQFCSSFWEDKKPVHQMLEDAYRQNRMSTTAAVRHLHSHHVNAPVFGLVWASGTVRAHVDWWSASEGKNKPPVSSTQVINPFLDKAADIAEVRIYLNKASPSELIQVFFLIENIDHWTMNGFCERAIKGVKDLEESVVKKDEPYMPWKR